MTENPRSPPWQPPEGFTPLFIGCPYCCAPVPATQVAYNSVAEALLSFAFVLERASPADVIEVIREVAGDLWQTQETAVSKAVRELSSVVAKSREKRAPDETVNQTDTTITNHDVT